MAGWRTVHAPGDCSVYHLLTMAELKVPARVHRLTITLANQIAAGEVVERPASVVKELLENSLDAGASEIAIDVERGGARLIRVRDNGEGIHREDLVLALDRHATSKITTLDDLEHVASLGFRGEALPSIASVSRFSLASRCEGAEPGWRVLAEGGPPQAEPEPVPHPVGTTVEARDLFFNTPARRKFLRSERTEFGHLQEVVRRIGLSRFDLAIRLTHDQRNVLSLRPGSDGPGRSRRLAVVCGSTFDQYAVAVESEAVGLRLWGWIGAPDYSRSQADIQYFFLNGRIVRDKLLSHAVRQACQDVLQQGRHPAYVLYLELDPTQTDVNVHPTKHEVRFRDGRLVHDFLFRSLARVLNPGASSELALADTVPATKVFAGSPRPGSPGPGRVREAVDNYAALARGTRQGDVAGSEASPLGLALGQLHGRYLLARNRAGLVLLDMTTARQRLTQARLRAALSAGEVKSQPLLVPISFALPAGLAGVVEEQRAFLGRLGFDLIRNGPESVAVHRMPALLRDAEPEPLVRTLLMALAKQGQNEPAGGELEALLVSLTAHASTTQRDQTPEELDGLLRQVEQEHALSAEMPVWVQLTERDLEGLFVGTGLRHRAPERSPQ